MKAQRNGLPVLRAVLVLAISGAADPEASHSQSMGAVRDLCDGSGSTVDTVACYDKAHKAADRDLNALYGRIRQILEPDELAALVRAELRWVQYRDSTCSAERQLYGNGTGGFPAYLACLTAETRSRHDSLLRSYGWVLDKRSSN